MKNLLNLSRRAFIQSSIAFVGLAAAGATDFNGLLAKGKPEVTMGIFTDSHYADSEMRGNRYYRESLAKLEECIKEFNSAEPDFVIELGDFVEKGESVAIELGYLEQIERVYSKSGVERHYVLGNHDLATFSKKQFIANCGAKKNHYSFDKGNCHFIILDACYNPDESDYNAGNFQWTESYIPSAEQEWLEADLQNTGKRTIIFVHQRLDDDGVHGVNNASEVREILERSEKVLAVFQGHDHRGAYKSINDIYYCTLPAVVEGSGPQNNAYALVRIWADGIIKIDGFGKQKDQELHSSG